MKKNNSRICRKGKGKEKLTKQRKPERKLSKKMSQTVRLSQKAKRKRAKMVSNPILPIKVRRKEEVVPRKVKTNRLLEDHHKHRIKTKKKKRKEAKFKNPKNPKSKRFPKRISIYQIQLRTPISINELPKRIKKDLKKIRSINCSRDLRSIFLRRKVMIMKLL